MPFHEIQTCRSRRMIWVYLLLLGMIGLFGYGFVQQVLLGKPFGDKPAPDIVLIIALLFLISLTALFYYTKLQTIIDDEGIRYRWWPLQHSFKIIPWKDIRSVQIIHFGFVGVGWRLTKYGMVTTTGATSGLMIDRVGKGRKIIATSEVEKLKNFLADFSQRPRQGGDARFVTND